MPSPVELPHKMAGNPPLKSISHLTRLAVLVAAGSVLFVFESAIPRPLPWLKPGLSNLVVLVVLYLYGFRSAFLIMLLRVLIGAMILGTLFNPAFLLAIGGGVTATIMMAVFLVAFGKQFSIIGISLIGAFAHNLAQVVLAAIWVIHSERVFYLAPIMLLSSLFSGFLVGIFAHYVVQKARKLRLVQT
jgi:heptaprenyl diphosphate synthase